MALPAAVFGAAGLVLALCVSILSQPDFFHLRLWETNYRHANEALASGDLELAEAYALASGKYAATAHDPLRAALSTRQLAEIAMRLDRPAEADSLIGRAINLFAVIEANSREPLQRKVIEQELTLCFLDRAKACAREGKLAEASSACERAVDLAGKYWDHGKDQYSGVVLSDALGLLANLEAKLGDRRAALHSARRCLALRQVFLDGKSLEEVRTLHAFLARQFREDAGIKASADGYGMPELAAWANFKKEAAALHRAGDNARAEILYGQALRLAEQSGQPDLRLAQTLMEIMAFYRDVGRFDRAEYFGRQAVDLWERLVGSLDPTVAAVHSIYANILLRRGKFGEAASQFGRAGSIYQGIARDTAAAEALANYLLAAQYSDRVRDFAAADFYAGKAELFVERLAVDRGQKRLYWRDIGRVFYAAGDLPAARDCFDRAGLSPARREPVTTGQSNAHPNH